MNNEGGIHTGYTGPKNCQKEIAGAIPHIPGRENGAGFSGVRITNNLLHSPRWGWAWSGRGGYGRWGSGLTPFGRLGSASACPCFTDLFPSLACRGVAWRVSREPPSEAWYRRWDSNPKGSQICNRQKCKNLR